MRGFASPGHAFAARGAALGPHRTREGAADSRPRPSTCNVSVPCGRCNEGARPCRRRTKSPNALRRGSGRQVCSHARCADAEARAAASSRKPWPGPERPRSCSSGPQPPWPRGLGLLSPAGVRRGCRAGERLRGQRKPGSPVRRSPAAVRPGASQATDWHPCAAGALGTPVLEVPKVLSPRSASAQFPPTPTLGLPLIRALVTPFGSPRHFRTVSPSQGPYHTGKGRVAA